MVNESATQFAFALDGLIRSRTKGDGGDEYARKCIHEMAEAIDNLFRTAYARKTEDADN